MLAEKIMHTQSSTKKTVGRPREHNNLITQIIDKYFAGDIEKAAQVWQFSKVHIYGVIARTKPLSAELKLRIHFSTKKEISLETLQNF